MRIGWLRFLNQGRYKVIMTDGELKKVQGQLLIIAKEIKRVCEKHGINYFLLGGTLIGAVRHKGFIPWDDDLDLGMLREDYEKFLEIAPSELSEDFCLQTMENDPEYGLAFAKVRMNGTVYREMTDPRIKAHQGFWVDVFPYDNIPDDNAELAQMADRIMDYRTLLLMKAGSTPWKVIPVFYKRWKSHMRYKKFINRAAKIPREQLVSDYNKEMKRYNESATARICQQSGGARFGKHPLDRNFLSEFTKLSFEDDEFQCPKRYDEFLRAIYGDYMQLPPEDQRHCTHGIIELKFREDTK